MKAKVVRPPATITVEMNEAEALALSALLGSISGQAMTLILDRAHPEARKVLQESGEMPEQGLSGTAIELFYTLRREGVNGCR